MRGPPRLPPGARLSRGAWGAPQRGPRRTKATLDRILRHGSNLTSICLSAWPTLQGCSEQQAGWLSEEERENQHFLKRFLFCFFAFQPGFSSFPFPATDTVPERRQESRKATTNFGQPFASPGWLESGSRRRAQGPGPGRGAKTACAEGSSVSIMNRRASSQLAPSSLPASGSLSAHCAPANNELAGSSTGRVRRPVG